MSIALITKYFPGLIETQIDQLEQLGHLYSYWNDRINLISRKDLNNLYERHILHSLAITKVFKFKPGTTILDAGTGGGFPGIPLAVMFPNCHFDLVDSTSKKLVAVKEISLSLSLRNVSVFHERLENLTGKYDLAVSRALASLPQTVKWVMKNISVPSNNEFENGLLYLKGGEFDDELNQIHQRYKIYPISDFFQEEYFYTKKIVHILK